MSTTSSSAGITVNTSEGVVYFCPGNSMPQKTVSNLQLLFNLAKPGFFRARNGHLEAVDGFCKRFSYSLNRQKEDAAVKEAIQKALQHLNAYLIKNKSDENVDRVAEILFNQIGKLNSGAMNRIHFCKYGELFKNYKVSVKIGSKTIELYDPMFRELDEHFLTFDLGEDNENFVELLKRKVGERFYLKNGKLKREFTLFPFLRKNQDKEIREIISRTFERLNKSLKYEDLKDVHKKVLFKIFRYTPLVRIKPVTRDKQDTEIKGIYDRGAVVKEETVLERVLAEALGLRILEKREALKQAMKDYNKSTPENQSQALAAWEAAFKAWAFKAGEFAYQLGIELERIKGGSGAAQLQRECFGRKASVVKAGDEGPYGKNNPSVLKIKGRFFARKYLNKSEHVIEETAYLGSRCIGFSHIPPTISRFTPSLNFVGENFKKSSRQLWVDECIPLSEYAKVPQIFSNFPRFFLEWYCGRDFGWLTRQAKRKELLQIIPQLSIEVIAALLLALEDTDDHLGNLLVLIRDAEKPLSLPERLRNREEVSDEEIDEFVNTMSSKGHSQEMLHAFLSSQKVKIDGKFKWVSFVKPDNGASQPCLHPPSAWAAHNEHAISIFPHCEKPFTTVKVNPEGFTSFLLVKTARALWDMLTPEVFKEFWAKWENRKNFKSWVLDAASDKTLEEKLITELVALTRISHQSAATGERFVQRSGEKYGLSKEVETYRSYFESKFDQIRKNIATCLDRWSLQLKYSRNGQPMRKALSVCTQADYDKEDLVKEKAEIKRHFDEAKKREVSKKLHFKKKHILAALGEQENVIG